MSEVIRERLDIGKTHRIQDFQQLDLNLVRENKVNSLIMNNKEFVCKLLNIAKLFKTIFSSDL
jgi:hypothetical protein